MPANSESLRAELESLIVRCKEVDETFSGYLDMCLHVWNEGESSQRRAMAALDRSTPADNSAKVREMGSELLSRKAGATELFAIITEELGDKFHKDPEEVLFEADKLYRDRIMESLRKLPRPETPPTFHYHFREHVKGAMNAGN